MRLREFFILCSSVFYARQGQRESDEAIWWVVRMFPQNSVLSQVLPKVTLVNSLYNANLPNPFAAVTHIVGIPDIDEKLQRGDLTVVQNIREQGRDEYVFATKYAHFHNPQQFPMCDNPIIDNLLPELAQIIDFPGERVTSAALRTYETLQQVIDRLTNYCNLQHFRYKEIDQALWIWAKWLNPGLSQEHSNWLSEWAQLCDIPDQLRGHALH